MLEGTRVVEMGVWVAGPATGGILADWGAEVIQDDPERNTVCVQAMTFEEIEETRSDQVCTGSDAEPTSSAGGAGGAGGATN